MVDKTRMDAVKWKKKRVVKLSKPDSFQSYCEPQGPELDPDVETRDQI